ncbi:MAG: hypothetical protein A6F70_06695 [Cycloclasticus sp. symbiont of Bathymodiolus heckerae]|nr:MAG: hypothetical protein A6F70_06695 [Cycloclasticus sp. symbiont of Bathymodiolus heckerae]
MKIKSLLLSFLIFLSCLTTTVQAATQSQAKEAILTAHNLWDKTKTAGHEWNTIKPLMAQATQALQENDYITAIALAKKASTQSKLALVQAEREKTNWLNNLPK